MVEPRTGDSPHDQVQLTARLRNNVDFPLEMPTDWKWNEGELCPPPKTVRKQYRTPSKVSSVLRQRPIHSVFTVSKCAGCIQKHIKIARMEAAIVQRNYRLAEEAERKAKQVQREAERKMLREADVVMKTHDVRYGLNDLCLNDPDPLPRKRGRHVLSFGSDSRFNTHSDAVKERPTKKRRTTGLYAGSKGNEGEERRFTEWLERVSWERKEMLWMRSRWNNGIE